MTYEQEFLKEFEAWIDTQIKINQMAMESSIEVWETDKKVEAREALLRYEAKLDAYQFLQGKFKNYKEGKSFHDIPDDLFGQRTY